MREHLQLYLNTLDLEGPNTPWPHLIRSKEKNLVICPPLGIAGEWEETEPFPYEDSYADEYYRREVTAIGYALHYARMEMVRRHGAARVIDVGIGSGQFLRMAWAAGVTAFGTDLCPKAVTYLKAEGAYLEPGQCAGQGIDTATLWDSIEHLPDPQGFLRELAVRRVLISVPLMEDIMDVGLSKHFKPREHLMYWTEHGFRRWMEHYGWSLQEFNRIEVTIGREQVGSFCFTR